MEWWSENVKKSVFLLPWWSVPSFLHYFLWFPSLLPDLMTFGLLRLWIRAQRACLAERELVTGRLAGLDALSARRDKRFTGWADCALLSGFTFSRIPLSLRELASSLSKWDLLSQSGSLSEPFRNISKSSLLQPKNPNKFNISHPNGASTV